MGFNMLLGDDHTSTDAFVPPIYIPDPYYPRVGTVRRPKPPFDEFRRWDAVYMIHTAEHGYAYEHVVAFYPAFPLIAKFGQW